MFRALWNERWEGTRIIVTAIRNITLGLLTIIGLLLLWGLAEPYSIDEEAHTATINALPSDWEEKRIAVIADLQVGMWLDNTGTIERIVNRLVRERPAAVLIAGDFVYRVGAEFEEAQQAARLLEPLVAAGVPTYAVLGNHDYGMPTKRATANEALAAAVRKALEDVGITVLQNQAVALPAPSGGQDEPLFLVGVGPHIPGNDHPEEALADVPDEAARVLLMHHPNSFSALPAGSAPFALAGHTHGGQFRLPFAPDWSWMTFSEGDEVHADGWIPDFGAQGNRLYVNRGIGMSVVPLRLNCPPELTWFTLTGA